MNIVSIFMLGGGALLLYCGIKDRNPKDVISDAIQGKSDPGKRADRDGKWGKLGQPPPPPGSFDPNPFFSRNANKPARFRDDIVDGGTAGV